MFLNDYLEGCHPNILALLEATNMQKEKGYGEDSLTETAKSSIKKWLKRDDVDIHFVSGGTQANIISLASMLRTHESVIAAETGHIAIHEAGAIEACGHKVCTIKAEEGKLTPAHVEAVLDHHEDEHMVSPKVVYISNATELGTVYSKDDLEALSKCCRKHNLYLYMDGARIGMAVCYPNSGLSLADICSYVDAFYIGATKNGGILGEAIVLVHEDLKDQFRYIIKQKGGLLAKGRLLGAQFQALFEGDLYMDLAQHANKMAEKLKQACAAEGYHFLGNSTTNQVFPILPNHIISVLETNYGLYRWQKMDDNYTAIRLVTSWATNENDVDAFIQDLKEVSLS